MEKQPLKYTPKEIAARKKAAIEARSNFILALEQASAKKGIRVLPSQVNKTEHVDTSPAMLEKAALRANETAREEEQIKHAAIVQTEDRIAKLAKRLETRQHAVCWQSDGDLTAVIDREREDYFSIQVYHKIPGRFVARAALHKGLNDTARYIITKGYDRIDKQG